MRYQRIENIAIFGHKTEKISTNLRFGSISVRKKSKCRQWAVFARPKWLQFFKLIRRFTFWHTLIGSVYIIQSVSFRHKTRLSSHFGQNSIFLHNIVLIANQKPYGGEMRRYDVALCFTNNRSFAFDCCTGACIMGKFAAVTKI